MKFQYAPGLPGYGTKGIDGSAGLLGMGLYFAEYDGTSDTTTISTKITNNKLLTTIDTDLPGTPTRFYQTGDFFIDKNGRVFKIDLGLSNNYVYTGSRMNTSSIFDQAGTTDGLSQEYTRYSNSFSGDHFLVDIVNTFDNVGDYAAAPTVASGAPYGIAGKNFGQYKYSDNSIGGYEAFEIWSATNSVSNPEKTIALVKEFDKDTWRLGNLITGGAARDVSLYLDFADVYTKNLDLSNDLTVTNDLDVNGDASVAGDLFLDGHSIRFKGGGSNWIRSEDWIIIKTDEVDDGGASFQAQLSTGATSGSTTGGNSGKLTLKTGNAGDNTGGTGGLGGEIWIDSGDGGDTTAGGTTYDGGYGGLINIDTGVGGTSNADDGGHGGNIDIDTGTGGSTSGHSGAVGGRGGRFFINTGTGGSGPAGGDAGDFVLTTGTGGITSNGIAAAGDGGLITVVTGAGGYGTSSGVAGDGGSISFAPGNGGNTSGSGSPGEGGSITLSPGDAGTGGVGGASDGNLYISNLPTSGTGNTHLGWNTSSNAVYTTTTAASSDIKLKTLKGEVVNAVDKLKTLQAYNWSYNEFSKEVFDIVDTEEQHIGLIAQDVIKVFPELVVDYKGNNDEPYLGLKYEMFAPILVEAIKEQQDQIDDLKAIVAQQQEQINQLLNK